MNADAEGNDHGEHGGTEKRGRAEFEQKETKVTKRRGEFDRGWR